MLTSNTTLNSSLSTATQLVSARRGTPRRGKILWRLLARRFRTYASESFEVNYAAYLESLTDKQYADLAGAFLANGFIHLGFPQQARVRMLLELHFSKQIAESLEELPVLVLLRSIRESPANILRSNEDAKALFLHLRGDTERTFNDSFGQTPHESHHAARRRC